MIDVWTFGRRYGMSYNAFLKHAMDFANFPWSFLSQPRPDFPGGAKKFCYLLNTWTRDLTGPQGMRHAFVQKGPHIICAQCRTSVPAFAVMGMSPVKTKIQGVLGYEDPESVFTIFHHINCVMRCEE